MTVRRKIVLCPVILDIWERCIPGVPIGAREDSPDSGEPFSGLVPRPRHRKHRRHDNVGWAHSAERTARTFVAALSASNRPASANDAT